MKHPLATNFKKLFQYDFRFTKLDEAIFFEWLIVKQKSFGEGNPFFYQNRRVIEELGIKRNRLNSIKLKFRDYGLNINCTGLLNATHYLVEYDFIEQFINNHVKHEEQHEMLKNIRHLNFKGENNITKSEKEQVIQFIQVLNEICKARKTIHINYGNINDDSSEVELPYNGKSIYQLHLLCKRYSKEVIIQTFQVFIDAMLLEKDFTPHYLNNFSSYDAHKDGFPVFDRYDRLVNDDDLPF
ncbi:hypothetical protein OO010_12545 [Flavobacteriaceae bacterium KMM 6898]|nr:hypothetical protein [Flavobacteriaceae bacterium KMM 6898]